MSACLVYLDKGRADIREMPIRLAPSSSSPDPQQPVTSDAPVTATALYSAISRGTERLVYHGNVPRSEWQRMRAPFQHGDFPFPVGYGYAWVGRLDGQDDKSRTDGLVFGLFPHQARVSAPVEAFVSLPDGLPPRRAVLAANMETALNIIWDASIDPGMHVAIVGGGVVGLLTAGIASAIPATKVNVIDTNPQRAKAAQGVGADFSHPHEAPDNQDVVIHTSASESGLKTALSLAGHEARVVEASWYGTTAPRVPLGETFHSRRLSLVSSQVAQVSPGLRPRWNHRRRLITALSLLSDPKYDALITGDIRFDALPARLDEILRHDADGLATAIHYS